VGFLYCSTRGTKNTGLKLSDGKVMNQIDEEGYKYLGIFEHDKIKEKEMKTQFTKEYKCGFRLILKSKLNGRNKIKAINTWMLEL